MLDDLLTSTLGILAVALMAAAFGSAAVDEAESLAKSAPAAIVTASAK